ncbi:acyl carrier protein [Paenibacillus sp. DS2015]|uniref:phosphopantetheine-binding protein n=1 Tax=Paenibacillus sp. DS2015 TaxID=3373917 RepID=UPI003D215389
MTVFSLTIEKRIELKVKEILEISENQEIGYKEDLSILGLDSLKSISLVVELEMLFDIAFEDEELLMQNFSSIEKIAQLVNEKVNN